MSEEKELIELIAKHIRIAENPEDDVLNVYIYCNGTMQRLDLRRKYIEQPHAVQPMFGPKLSSIVPTKDTLDINRFKNLWNGVFEDE